MAAANHSPIAASLLPAKAAVVSAADQLIAAPAWSDPAINSKEAGVAPAFSRNAATTNVLESAMASKFPAFVAFVEKAEKEGKLKTPGGSPAFSEKAGCSYLEDDDSLGQSEELLENLESFLSLWLVSWFGCACSGWIWYRDGFDLMYAEACSQPI